MKIHCIEAFLLIETNEVIYMSGPKSSSYTLSYKQRKILEEEQRRRREQEEERKRVEMEFQRKQVNIQKLSESIDIVSAQVHRLEKLQHESGHNISILPDTKNTIFSIKRQMEHMSGNGSLTSSDLKIENEQI